VSTSTSNHKLTDPPGPITASAKVRKRGGKLRGLRYVRRKIKTERIKSQREFTVSQQKNGGGTGDSKIWLMHRPRAKRRGHLHGANKTKVLTRVHHSDRVV